MSSIRLSGTSSGYYDLTVPAAAGTNSIDLSNLAVKDSNGNLGIGTLSPSASHRLTLDKTSNYGGISFNQNGNQVGQIIQEGATGNIYIDADSNSIGGGLIFRTTGGTTRMTVDGSGHVTQPNLPSFLTYGTPSITSVGSDSYYFHSFGNGGESYNNGSHYDNASGKFTAPVAGRYAFGFSVWRAQAYSGGDQLIYINKNSYASGGAYVGSNASGSQYDQIEVHLTYNMAANDWVAPGLYYTGTFSIQASTPRNYFYGYLIG